MNAIQAAYYKRLMSLIEKVRRDIDLAIIPLIEKYEEQYATSMDGVTFDGWGDSISDAINLILDKYRNGFYKSLVNDIASQFVTSALAYADRKNKRSFGIDVYQNSPKIRQYLEAATAQNSQLIQSIPEQYLNQVSNIVLGNMRAGLRSSEIISQLTEQYGITKRRAKFIARDQTAKVNGEISKQRQIDAGYEYFQWIDAHDSRVRHRHKVIATAKTQYGTGVYRWDDLPLSEKGERIQPGSDYNCRCIAKPMSTSKVEKHMKSSK